jgi:hypothetical protein
MVNQDLIAVPEGKTELMLLRMLGITDHASREIRLQQGLAVDVIIFDKDPEIFHTRHPIFSLRVLIHTHTH